MFWRPRWVAVVAAASVAVLPLGGASAHGDAAPNTAFLVHFDEAVPDAARDAVGFAARTWQARVLSSVPVEIDLEWAPLPHGVAGASEPTSFVQAQRDGPLEPVALANARAGRDHDPGASDMRITLNAAEPWYFGEAQAPAGRTDLIAFVLHEVGHGLGLVGSFVQPTHDQLAWGRPDASGVVRPLGLDRLVVDASSNAALVDERAFANPSHGLLVAGTSGNVIWGGAASDASGAPIRMYSPPAYEHWSSLMHLDDAAYPPGHPDALMTSFIPRGESIRRIGPAALGMLADLGWTVARETGVASASVAAARPPARVRLAAASPSPSPSQAVTPTTTATTVAPVLLSASEGSVARLGVASPLSPVVALPLVVFARRMARRGRRRP